MHMFLIYSIFIYLHYPLKVLHKVSGEGEDYNIWIIFHIVLIEICIVCGIYLE